MNYSNFTKEEIVDGIKNSQIYFEDLSEELRDDKEIVLTAVKKFGLALSYVSERLKDNEDVVIEAINQNGYALNYASERLKNDKDVVLLAFKVSKFTLKFASNILQSDMELLKLLELSKNEDMSGWHPDNKTWYEERMKVLDNLREKELIEKSITTNNKSTKKLKF